MRPEPDWIGGAAGKYIFFGNLLADIQRQPQRAAGQKQSAARQARMLRDEIAAGNAIAVAKHQIFGRGLGDGPVQNRTLAKTQIFVPDVPDRQPAFGPQTL